MLNIIVSAILILVSLLWMYMGIFIYGLWVPGVSAHTGFIPTIFGGIILIFSIIKLVKDIKTLKADAHERYERSFAGVMTKLKPLLPAATAAVAIILIKILGMVIGTYLALFLYMKVVNRERWVKSLLVTAVVTAFFYAVFVLWLKVPFPRGIFGI